MEWRAASRGWLFFSVFVAILFTLPLVYIVSTAASEVSEQWQAVSEIVLPQMFLNTLLLLLGTLLLTVVFGVSAAWLVANYRFPGRNLFKGGLLLPLAFPTYILAYIAGGIFDSTGSLRSILVQLDFIQPDDTWSVHIFNPVVLVVLLSLALYPYVYASSLASFSFQSANFIETAKSLGKNPLKVFLKVGIPLSRPAIFGGMFLVAMEVLNEYGAVKYFNIKTLTSGIFTTWQLNDLAAASRLAILLLGFVVLFVVLEKWSRKNRGYSNNTRTKPIEPFKLKGWQKWGAFVFCLIPFFWGFVLPFSQLLYWSINQLELFDTKFFIIVWNSIVVAIVIALIIVSLAFALTYAGFFNQGRLSKLGVNFGSFGYAIPGAVVAIGITSIFTDIDAFTGVGWLSGSFIALFLAYIIRFLAVASNPIEGNMLKIGQSRIEVSRNLGKSSWKTLLLVQTPLLKPILVAGVILVTIDILKELPLTLILRPVNFNTLATRTYDIAQTYESADMAAPYALFIVLLSILPLLFVNKLLSK
ncbi:MAG: ABC transporter permease [Flavobacteriales bacterium]